ncbi:MAG: phage tail tape measure protein [Bacteroidetes bacterium]|nr:phage tail tape measure protein [Bacteroidota bacterium]
MAKNETSTATVILNGEKANASLKQLEAEARKLNAELRQLNVNSKEFADKEKEFQKVNGRVRDLRGEINQSGTAFSKLADQANKYQQILQMITIGLIGFGASLVGLIKGNAKLEDSLADIRKTTKLTVDEVKKLNTELGKIDTRTSRSDLREMAVVAGQLGIAQKDILPFVDSIDKLNVALGAEIQGGASEVATQMGTLRNVLTDMKTSAVSDDMLRLGNAIDVLGADGFATAPVLVDLSNRIGGVGMSLGLTSDEVIGISATLQELAVSTERGGTAMTKILMKMTYNTADFAKVAGMPLKEFTNLVNTDLYGAFVKVVEGSKRGGEGATILGKLIRELEISGAGASEVFAKLGNNTAMLQQKVDLAGKSLQGTDEILRQFNDKNTTLGATLDKLGKEFYRLITLPGVTEFLKSMVGSVVNLVAWLKALPEWIDKYRIQLIALTGAIGVYIAAQTRSIQVSILNNLTLKEGILLRMKDAVVLEYLVVKEQLLTIWKSNGTVATKLATTAQWLWNAAMAANPIGLVIAGITALVAGIKAYEMYNEEAIALEKEKASTTVLLAQANQKLEDAYEKVSATIRNLNLLSVQEKKDLRDKIDLTIKQAEAELLLMQAKQKKIGDASAKPTFFQQAWNAVKGGMGPAATATTIASNAIDAQENRQEATKPYDEGIKSLQDKIAQFKDAKQSLSDILNAESIADNIVGESLDNLEAKLSKYQIALKASVAGSEDFIRVQGKIKDLNKKIQSFDKSDPSSGTSSEGDPNAKKQAAYLLDIKKQLAEARAAVTQGEMERELAIEEEKLGERFAKIKGNSAEEMELRKLLTDQLIEKQDEIRKKYADKELEAQYKVDKEKADAKLESLNQSSDEYLQALLESLQMEMDYTLAVTKATEQQRLAIQEAFAQRGANAVTKHNEKDARNLLDYQEQLKSLKLKSDIDLADKQLKIKLEVDAKYKKILEDNVNDERRTAEIKMQMAEEVAARQAQLSKENATQVANDAIGLAKGAVDGLAAIYSMQTDAKNQQLRENEEANNKKKENLQKQLDAGLISKAQYDAQVGKMDKDLAAKKKKMEHDQAVRNKEVALFNALISVATAVASALSAGPGVGIVLSIITAALGAIQIGYILSQKVPEAASGRYSVIGQQDNKLYRDVPYVDSPQTGLYSTPTLISETGQEIVIDPKTTKNLMVNYPQVIDAINFARVPQRAMGRYADAPPWSPGGIPGVVDPEFTASINRLNSLIENGIPAFISFDHLRETTSRVNEIEAEVSK